MSRLKKWAALAGAVLAVTLGAALAVPASAAPVVTVTYSSGTNANNAAGFVTLQPNLVSGQVVSLTLDPGGLTLPGSAADFELNGSNPGWQISSNVLTGTSAQNPNLVVTDGVGDKVFFTLKGLKADASGHISAVGGCVTGPLPLTLNLASAGCAIDDVIMQDPPVVAGSGQVSEIACPNPLGTVIHCTGLPPSESTPPVAYALYRDQSGTTAVPGAVIDSLGVIHADPSTAVNGTNTYLVRVVGTDSIGAAGVEEFYLTVNASGVAADAVTVTDPGSQTSTAGSPVSPLTVHASSSAGDAITGFSATGLPAGLSISASGVISGTPATAGVSTVTVTAADSAGTHGSASFAWVIQSATAPPPSSSVYGDEVNPFGNGFDVFRQQYRAGTPIAGWRATQHDPATHFTRFAAGSGWRFEATRGNGVLTGLCVSDPGGGWASDPLADGLILTPCNTGPWQVFVQSGAYLKNLKTGLYVNPDGTGAQLRGAGSPSPWGGSKYAWRDFSALPA